ncbi:GAF domain-containing protein [Kitasatospora sp. NPDC053057]|uniref:sensor histidine kinase n=1 Tax=Kitasatospora sp. NPDC053057 TaxID=3364062 RepID=UPI0037CBDB2C
MGGEASENPARLPRLQLDELLDELQARLDAARGTRDRVHSLLEAVLSVGRELELRQVLQHIVESAVVLVDAEYGALGVIGDDEWLVQFLPVGVTDEQVRRIGRLPSGHGLLGELIRNPVPLRLAEISEHPSSYGFPAGHPPMHSFLGVPIRVRDQVFGNLYLTEKRGGEEFDGEDEAVLSTLAVAAGVAIDNARLYEESRLRERWLAVSGEVTSGLLSGIERPQVLGLIVDRAREITGADLAVIAVPVAGSSELRVEVAVGMDADEHRGLVLPTEGSFVGAAFRAAEPVTSTDVQQDPQITAGPPRWSGLGPAVAVSMGTAAGGVRGVLMLARAAGSPLFTARESGPLLGFAGQAALAMEVAERRREAERLALLEDHDRIARDLHDLAIQRLFATGMTLQSTQRFIEHPQVAERVQEAVDDLDVTVKIIRSTIFGLRANDSGPTARGLRVRIAEAVERAAHALGFAPALRTEGLLDTRVPPDVADAVLAVLGEALSNVARHARASAAEVALSVGTELVLTVTDDGVGIPARGRRSGLLNLAERARQLKGELRVGTRPQGGTELVWRVPLGSS